MVNILLIILALNIHIVYNYVICDEGIACYDGYICCKKPSGYYKCCPSDKYCCTNNKKGCCDYSIPFLEDMTEDEVLRDEYQTQDAFNISSFNTTVSIDNSLESIPCLSDIDKFIKKAKLAYSIITNHTMYNNKTEYFSKTTFALSEVLYYATNIMHNCKIKDLPILIDNLITNINKEDYLNLLTHKMKHNTEIIKSYFDEVTIILNKIDINEIGDILKKLIRVIFYVDSKVDDN